jgi:MFS family permease
VTNGLAVKFGKRPIFLLGNTILFVSSLWASFENSFEGLFASRMFGCVGMSPFEVLVTATITDIYYVHQRGLRLAAWGVSLSVGVGASGIISGYVIEDLGWQWTYKLAAIFFGVLFPPLVYFCPETAYTRSADLNIDLGTINHAKELEAELEEVEIVCGTVGENEKTEKGSAGEQERNALALENQLAAQHGANEQPKTKWEELKVFDGIKSPDNLIKVILRPFPMLLFPQVLYAFITYGLSTSWLIVLGSVSALIFGSPPYNMSVGEIGLLQIAGLITSLLGFVAGPINDYLCKWLARRNNGTYEPEVSSAYCIV